MNHKHPLKPEGFGREESHSESEWRQDAAGGRGARRMRWVCLPGRALPYPGSPRLGWPWA